MADLTPYTFPDGDDDSQQWFIEQQLAETARAKRTQVQDRSIERHPIGDLIKLDDHLREKRNRPQRMRTILTRHTRN